MAIVAINGWNRLQSRSIPLRTAVTCPSLGVGELFVVPEWINGSRSSLPLDDIEALIFG